MGLHNPNDWRYRQGPGNLFNTYLGNSPSPRKRSPKRPAAPPPVRQAEKAAVEKTRSEQRAPVAAWVATQRAPVSQLVAFLHDNASGTEADRFLERVAKFKGVAIQSGKSRRSEIERVARTHLTDAEVEKYLAELRRRRAAGEPLIRSY